MSSNQHRLNWTHRSWRVSKRQLSFVATKITSLLRHMLLLRSNQLQRRENTRELKRHDQNFDNAVRQNDWAKISPLWNSKYAWSAPPFSVFACPSIIHFIGPAKPWKDEAGQFVPRFARSFVHFVKTHFPDTKQVETGLQQLASNSTEMIKILLKHLVSARKMARYLTRFPNELTVHR